MKKQILTTLLLCATVSLISSCRGYQIGEIKHPQIDSIAIAPVKNMTARSRLSIDLQAGLRLAIQGDGTYKLKDSKLSDCIVHAKITKGVTHGVGTSYRSNDKEDKDTSNYGTTMYKYLIEVEYTVLIPGRNRPLIQTTVVTGENRFTALADIEQSRGLAAKRAANDAAKKIIANITEAW